MTFTDIVNEVQSRLNLTSTTSATRIGIELNDRYRRITSMFALKTTRRGTVQNNATLGQTTLTFSNVEKLYNVVDRSGTPYRILKEITVEELRTVQPSSNSFAQFYAIVGQTANTITIEMDCVPQTNFTLYADAVLNLATLSGLQVPVIPESFHDVLVFGVCADEARKMEKAKLAQDYENQFTQRLGDLRLHLSVSSYIDITQGGNRFGLVVQDGVAGGAGGGSSFNGAQSWTQTGLITFNLTGNPPGSRAPFVIAAGSEVVPNLLVQDTGVVFTNNTTGNVSSTAHGYAPVSPGDATQYLAGGATPGWQKVKDSDLSLSAITTNNVSSTKHGFAPQLPNDVTQLFQGDGTYAVRTATVTSSVTGNQNGAWFTLPKTSRVVLYLTNASLLTIQSIPAGWFDGQELQLISQGAGQVQLAHASGSGTAGQLLNNIATSGNTYLAAASGSAKVTWDATNTRWNLIQHEQGAYIEYSAVSTITGWSAFTTETLRFKLTGRQFVVVWDLEGTSNSTLTNFTIPYKAVNFGLQMPGFCIVTDNGTVQAALGFSRIVANTSTLNTFKDATGTAWTASGTKASQGSSSFDVQ